MTFTLLFSQPVSALQIFNKEGQWKWVRHVENGVVSVVFSVIRVTDPDTSPARKYWGGR